MSFRLYMALYIFFKNLQNKTNLPIDIMPWLWVWPSGSLVTPVFCFLSSPFLICSTSSTWELDCPKPFFGPRFLPTVFHWLTIVPLLLRLLFKQDAQESNDISNSSKKWHEKLFSRVAAIASPPKYVRTTKTVHIILQSSPFSCHQEGGPFPYPSFTRKSAYLFEWNYPATTTT